MNPDLAWRWCLSRIEMNRDELDFSTAFSANVAIGILSYLILYFSAPFIADFYNNQRLIGVMRILSLNIIINSFGIVPLSKFTIAVNIKSLAKASLVAALVSGVVGISYAYYFHDVYALVLQSITYSLTNVVMMSMIIHWTPVFQFSIARFKQMFQYAYKLICARIINIVFDDIYSLAIGKLYSPGVLGCYNRSMSFRQVLSKNIINIVQRVSYPLLCKEQDDFIRMQQVLLSIE